MSKNGDNSFKSTPIPVPNSDRVPGYNRKISGRPKQTHIKTSKSIKDQGDVKCDNEKWKLLFAGNNDGVKSAPTKVSPKEAVGLLGDLLGRDSNGSEGNLL